MELQTSNHFPTSEKELRAWQQLILATPCQPFFMNPSYQTLWWKHLGRGNLEVITFFDKKTLVGLTALFTETINHKKIKRLVGAVDETDYLDVIFKPKFVTQGYEKLLDHFAQDITWDEIWLESLPQTSKTHTQFAEIVKVKGWQVTRKDQTVSPVITLPNDWPTFVSSLDFKQQKNFKHLLIKIGEEDEISYRLITQAQEMPQAMETFIQLHKASSTIKASFWNPAREAFFIEVATELAKQDLVKLYFLDVNGQPGATMLVFDWQNQFLLYNSGFDAYQFGHLGVSNALVLYTIQEAIKLKRSRYDFMRGDEAYKFAFGPVAEPVYDLVISRK